LRVVRLTAVFVCVSYNHSRDDDEVYKEFLEIANEIIPQILRMDHDGVLTRDPDAYALLLQFYDGLCCWEEDSQTPVLHITWATHMLSSIGKFDSSARTSVELLDTRVERDQITTSEQEADKTVNGSVRPHRARKRPLGVRTEPKEIGVKSDDVPSVGKSNGAGLHALQVATVDYCESGGSSEVSPFGIDSQLTPSSDELKMNLVVEQLASQSDENTDELDRSSEIDALAHACGESLLNPDFLRGSGEPFVKDENHQLLSSATATQMDLNAFAACTTADPSSNVNAGNITAGSKQSPTSEVLTERRPQLPLHSVKMLALKQLLVAPKLNASAIKLHLTAQSQVAHKPTHIGRPMSTQFYSDNRHRRAIKRRAND